MRIILYSSKKTIARALDYFGYLHFRLSKLSQQPLIILMYHRVLTQNHIDPWLQPGMYIHPQTLDLHIQYLNQYVHFVNFQSLNTYSNNRPSCILTFDDGWREFYTHASPILQRYSVPATVFLPTGYIGTDRWFWTDRLGRALFSLQSYHCSDNRANQGTAENLVYSISRMKGAFPQKLEQSISLLKKYSSDTIEDVLSHLEILAGVNTNGERAFLSWEEVRALKASDLVSFGSHTVNHSILTNIEDEKGLDRELFDSKSELINQGAVSENEPIPFCYPNGNYNPAIKEKVSSIYDWACTTKSGLNGPDCDPYALRRVGLHEDMAKTNGLLGCRVLGIF